jgi:hypothetical protein
VEKPETVKNTESNLISSNENNETRKNLLEIAGYGGISATANIISYKVGDYIRMVQPKGEVHVYSPRGASCRDDHIPARANTGNIRMVLPKKRVQNKAPVTLAAGTTISPPVLIQALYGWHRPNMGLRIAHLGVSADGKTISPPVSTHQ